MKALSLWQPWASLIMWGDKEFETRSWPAPDWLIGQHIVIHAAQKRLARGPVTQPALVGHTYFLQSFREQLIRDWDELPYGAALGEVLVKGCWPVEYLRDLSDKERAFGDYTPGRFAWWFTTIQPYVQPIPYRGAQGLFNYVPPLVTP